MHGDTLAQSAFENVSGADIVLTERRKNSQSIETSISSPTPQVHVSHRIEENIQPNNSILIQDAPVSQGIETCQQRSEIQAIQSSITSFCNYPDETNEPSLSHIPNDINKILVAINELQLNNKDTSVLNKSSQGYDSLDIREMKTARNLWELCKQENLKIDLLEDGCSAVTCIPCNAFVKADTSTKM